MINSFHYGYDLVMTLDCVVVALISKEVSYQEILLSCSAISKSIHTVPNLTQ